MMSSRIRGSILTAAVFTLAACSSDETIVALTVNSTSVGEVSTLNVVIAGSGKSHSTSFAPPLVDVPADADAGTPASKAIKSSFFHRIGLPDGWADGEATITVDAQYNGTAVVSGTDTAKVLEGETVAATVELDLSPDTATGGATGTAGAGGAGEATGTGGDATGTGGDATGTGGDATGTGGDATAIAGSAGSAPTP